MHEELPKRYLTEEVIKTFYEAVEHFETDDLVVSLVIENVKPEGADPVGARIEEHKYTVFLRNDFINGPDCPEYLQRKMARPAKEVAADPNDGASFWFILSPPDTDNVICCTVHAWRVDKLPVWMTKGGTA